jgi:hypothetical protein
MAGKDVDMRWHLLDEPPSNELPQLLLKELESTLEFFNEDSENQFRRRTLCRNAFAFVEGILHYLKANTFSHYIRIVQPVVMFWKAHFDLDFPESGFFRLVDDDVLLSLLDKKVHIDEAGKWHLRDSWLSTSTNTRFTFRIVAHVYGIDNKSFEEDGWDAFRRCVTIRNRVTHPNVLDEFHVKDSEIEDLNKALNWFEREARFLITETGRAIEWDQKHIDRFVALVPADERGAFVSRLIEILDLTEDDLKAAK